MKSEIIWTHRIMKNMKLRIYKDFKCTYDVTNNFNLHKLCNKSESFLFFTILRYFTISAEH